MREKHRERETFIDAAMNGPSEILLFYQRLKRALYNAKEAQYKDQKSHIDTRRVVSLA